MGNFLILCIKIFISGSTADKASKGEFSPVTRYSTVTPSTCAIIEASSDVEFSRQAAQDRVINELRNRAARLGANGVLLLSTGSQSGDTVGFFSGNMFYAGASERITAQGRAIFVIQE